MTETRQSFLPLYITNFFGVVNDNFLKTLAGFVVMSWLPDEKMQSVYMNITAAALVLPYILCSPLADRLTAIFSKRRIVQLAKWAELPIMAVAIAGFLLHQPALVVASVLLMGLQSSLYSPAKYALVRDVGGEGRISTGMGGMEGVTFLAVLAGTIVASFASDGVGAKLPANLPGWLAQLMGLWGGLLLPCAGLVVFATLGLVFSHAIRADEQPNKADNDINPVTYLIKAYTYAETYPGLNSVIFTLSVFWGAAAMLQVGLLVYGKQVLGLDATHTGFILAGAAIGIVAGQVIAGFIDKRHFLLGASLLTGGLAAILFAVLFFVPMGSYPFCALIGVLAFTLGIFKLPFDAEIQKTVKGPKLNTMLAYFNQVSFICMLLGSVVNLVISYAFGPRAFLLVLALVFAVVPVAFIFTYRSVLLFTAHWIFRRRYDVAVDGLGCFETGKTYLVLPNHPAMVDPMLVGTELWRSPVKPLCDELFIDRGGVSGRVLKTLGAVRVPDLRKHRSEAGAKIARGLTGVVTDALAAGDNVIFYPSGHIWTEPKEEIGTRQLAYNVCRELPPNVEVIGVRTLGLWGSIWGRKGRAASPSFGPTLVKSVFLWLAVLVTRRRRPVTMHLENLTDQVNTWTKLTRLEFNKQLEAWYNTGDVK